MRFAIDPLASIYLLLGFISIFLLMRLFFAKAAAPAIAFSKVEALKQSTWKTKLMAYLPKLYGLALLAMMLAFIDPHFLSTPQLPQQQKTSENEGVAIYLVLDQSGSMNKEVANPNDRNQPLIKKIDLLKQVTKQFIKEDQSDLMGLVAFARIPQVLVPLTLDKEVLMQKLDQIAVVKSPEQDGTSIGYAIYKTAQLIKATRHFSENLKNENRSPPFTIKGSAIIVVTDGFQDPSRLDYGNRLRTIELDDAAKFAKNENIHLFIINIDPAFSQSKFAPHRRLFKKITEETGGQFFLAGDQQSLQEIYREIAKLEKGKIIKKGVTKPKEFQKGIRFFSFYPFLIAFSLMVSLIAFLFEKLFLRPVP
jgi:Ca-activated chloride channel homolog